MNIWDILILAAIGCALFFAVRRTGKSRHRGGCSCGCEGCRGCGARRAGSPKNDHEA